MTAMSEYLADPHRHVTPEQHALLREIDAAGSLPWVSSPPLNRLYLRGLVERTDRRAYQLNPAGRSVPIALETRN